MTRPFLLAQLSDPHVGAAWIPADPAARLAAAVDAIRALDPQPDAVLVSGDLAEHAADAEYEQARELLERLQRPIHVLPGNHDDRETLRRHFDVAGGDREPVQYAVDLGPLRLVALDTTRPGEDAGALDSGRLEWLDAELARVPDVTTIVAMHHPPLATGVPAWDELGLPAADRYALAAVIRRHPHVRRIAAGHVHRVIASDLAGCAVLAVPSTYVQTRLNLASSEIELVDEPAAFALHAVLDGGIVSHVQPVNRAEPGA